LRKLPPGVGGAGVDFESEEESEAKEEAVGGERLRRFRNAGPSHRLSPLLHRSHALPSSI